MGSWHVRASAASITGACVFAVVTGAGAVFVGDWWGSSHHSTVVTEFVTAPASPAHGRHPAVTRSAAPVQAARHTSDGTSRTPAQADAQTARVTRSAPKAPAAPAPPARTAAAPPNAPGPAAGDSQDGNSQGGNGQDGNGSQGPGDAQGQGASDPASAPATPTASASAPAPAATPTAGTAGGDQG